MNEDTIRLLGECSAGIEMAVGSIDEVLPAVASPRLRRTLTGSLQEHQRLAERTQELLENGGASGKSPNAMAKSMSWVKTNTKLALKPGDPTVADLIVAGCDMGVRSLHRYENQYPTADEGARGVADTLIGIEQNLAAALYPFL